MISPSLLGIFVSIYTFKLDTLFHNDLPESLAILS
jgi:hypothetical protein